MVKQPKKEWCTRARQPMNELCMGVRQLPLENLCIGVRELQLGVRHLPLEDQVCVGITQLQLEDMNWNYTTPNIWMLFIGARQLSMNS